MVANRLIPCPDTGSSTVASAADWADDVNEEIVALWARATEQLSSVAGTNVITASAAITLTGYAAGQKFTFVPAATNTGATTLNVDSQGAVAIVDRSGSGLTGGELLSGERTLVEYDGTSFVLLTPSAATGTSPVPGGIFEDQKALGVDGGTFTSGADRTRTINTTVRNVIGASLSSNQITLPAGTYYVEWEVTAYDVGTHSSFLYNVTDASEVGRALLLYSDYHQVNSKGSAYFTIAASKAFEVRHRCTTTQSTDGFGFAQSYGSVERYLRVQIWKEA